MLQKNIKNNFAFKREKVVCKSAFVFFYPEITSPVDPFGLLSNTESPL